MLVLVLVLVLGLGLGLEPALRLGLGLGLGSAPAARPSPWTLARSCSCPHSLWREGRAVHRGEAFPLPFPWASCPLPQGTYGAPEVVPAASLAAWWPSGEATSRRPALDSAAPLRRGLHVSTATHRAPSSLSGWCRHAARR